MGSELSVDVAIVGGGPIGLSLGINLAQAGVSVALMDREAPDQKVAQPLDGRSFAIAYGSTTILNNIGVWSNIAALAQPILQIRVADNNAPLFLHYNHREVGETPFGWIVESYILRRALLHRAAELKELHHLAPTTVDRVERNAESGNVLLADGRQVKARLIVAADGKTSGIRRRAGIKAIDWKYGQDAITMTVLHERPHHGVAVEHFLPAGPFAILPMTDEADSRHRSSIVWTEKSNVAKHIMTLDESAFSKELARRFGDFLGAVHPVGPRWCHPLSLSYAHHFVERRLALVGDTAHAIHPIAGQGLNLGIRGTDVLAKLVIERCRLGLDPGSPDVLAKYQKRRRFDALSLTAVTDGLNRLFSNEIAPIKLVRDLGLAAVGARPLTPLRKMLMRHAMGTSIFG